MARLRLPFRLIWFGVAGVTAFAVGFLAFNVGQAQVFIQRFGYYTITLTFAWALFAWYRVLPGYFAPFRRLSRREISAAVGTVVILTLIAVLTIPGGYKILYDELVLQATSVNMHLSREVNTVVRGYVVDGVFAPIDKYLDKRPFFFSYLVSILHDLTGYRERNAFLLNTALMPVVLMQLYLIVRQVASATAAMAALLALGTLSTLAHSATGAGMEMLNLSMLLLAVQLAIYYLEEPDEIRLSAMVLTVVLLSETRYESTLYVGPIAIIAIEGWRRRGRIILPLAGIIAPVLLIPYAIHNTYLSGSPSLWELRQDESVRFSVSYLSRNLSHAITYFFGPMSRGSIITTNSLWLSVVGFTGLVYSLVLLGRELRFWRALSPVVFASTLFGAAICANLGLLMVYYWGELDDPIVSRLCLPFSALLAVGVAVCVHRFNRPGLHLGRVAAIGAIVSFLSYGAKANATHMYTNIIRSELLWQDRYFNALPPGERMVITARSSLPWIVQHVPAIAIPRARSRVDALRFQLAQHTFREILVIQSYVPTGEDGDFVPPPEDRLPASFILQPLAEKRFNTHFLRVSRLVEIKDELPQANKTLPDADRLTNPSKSEI